MSTAASSLAGLFDPMPAGDSLYLITSSGDYNNSVLVLGLEGVRREILTIFMADAEAEPDSMCAGILEQIDDPEEWAENGRSMGDGAPRWHISWSFEDGSLDIQRVKTIKC